MVDLESTVEIFVHRGENLGASMLHFLALARADVILARHLPEFSIHHRMPETYYRALLLLTSPSSLEGFRRLLASASMGSFGAAHFEGLLADVSPEDASALGDMPPADEELSLEDVPELSDAQAEVLAAQMAGGVLPAGMVDLKRTVEISVPSGASSASGVPATLPVKTGAAGSACTLYAMCIQNVSNIGRWVGSHLCRKALHSSPLGPFRPHASKWTSTRPQIPRQSR